MKRNIIRIDADTCNGCGSCAKGCPEGAIQMVDGKARLVGDLLCDGLGACIGECPVGAITIEEREAEPYNECLVLDNIIPQGANTLAAHLRHLHSHQQHAYLQEALDILRQRGIPAPDYTNQLACGCPGSSARSLHVGESAPACSNQPMQSQLRQWPVQLQLINPDAPCFDNADLLICADCVPFAYPNFHEKFLKGRIPIMFCPKLDRTIDQYIEKLALIFQRHVIRSVTVARMEVPCCGGVEVILQKAIKQAGKPVMVRVTVVNIDGSVE